jgi:peptide/nickel transport system ATP-binding protein
VTEVRNEPLDPRQVVLEVSGLTVQVARGEPIVEDVALQLKQGEIVGLVGESGSGKTSTALALLGYSAAGVKIVSGTLSLVGTQVRMDDSLRPSRGSTISYIPQDPNRALNPSLRVTGAIRDVVKAHRADADQNETVTRLLGTVGLPSSQEFARRYPHQLSGGQQQRVSIALALSCDPKVMVLDEPTTGLDVVTQDLILKELLRLRDEQNLSMVYVTHDLAVVANIADRIVVMYAGRIVEQGRADVVLRRPRHPYTQGLLASIPDHLAPRTLESMPGVAVAVGERPGGCSFAPRCGQKTARCELERPPLAEIAATHEVRCFHWEDTPLVKSSHRVTEAPNLGEQGQSILRVDQLCAEHRLRRETLVVARDVSFTVSAGSCVALVGESGSGKTTIARAIAGLHPVASGRILLGDEVLPSLIRRRSLDQRRRVQLVSQNPASALNPRQTVEQAIERPARVLRGMDRRAARAEVARLLECVRLPQRSAQRYPVELSGGERQRVAIARALAAEPDVILCDEITSALDVSVQAAVLKVLEDLRRELGLSVLFITHDLGVISTIADEVLVLEVGNVCERGPTSEVLNAPKHPYTKRLLEAAPSISDALGKWEAAGARSDVRQSAFPRAAS